MKTKVTARVRRTAAAAAIAVLGALVPSGSAHGLATFSLTRIAGDSRYATAAKIAIDSFGKSSGVIIATGEAFPDALAASFIAGYVNSPILLVQRNAVPDATKAALTELGVKEVVLLGGTAAISDAVQKQLDETYDVVRLQGQDRFATAANIALAVNPGDIGELDGQRTAFLAYGYGYADALAVGPLSFAGRFPILLNGRGALGTPAKIALDRLQITHVVIVGGVISKEAEVAINGMKITTERVQGADRFLTATAVADFALKRLAFVPEHVNIVRGIDPGDPQSGFQDALAGSVHAGIEQVPLLLTHPTTLSPATNAWLEAHASTLADGDILGGAGAVSPAVADAATAAARRVPGRVTSIDLGANKYTYDFGDGTTPVTVTYASGDVFTVDGAPATIDAFEAAIGEGDQIRYTTAGGAHHALTNAQPPATTA